MKMQIHERSWEMSCPRVSLTILGYKIAYIGVNMRQLLVEVYREGEINLGSYYTPGFCETEDQGGGFTNCYDLEQMLANDEMSLAFIEAFSNEDFAIETTVLGHGQVF